MRGDDAGAVLVELLRRRAHGDGPGTAELLHPDARLFTAGDMASVSGLMTRDEYLGGGSAALRQLVAGPPRLVLGRVFSSGPHVALEMSSTIPLTNGRTYENHYAILAEVRDGQVRVRKEFLDTKHFAEAFAGTPLMDGAPIERPSPLFDVEPRELA